MPITNWDVEALPDNGWVGVPARRSTALGEDLQCARLCIEQGNEEPARLITGQWTADSGQRTADSGQRQGTKLDTNTKRAPEENFEKARKAPVSRLKRKGVETDKITINTSRNSDDNPFSRPSRCLRARFHGRTRKAGKQNTRGTAEPKSERKT